MSSSAMPPSSPTPANRHEDLSHRDDQLGLAVDFHWRPNINASVHSIVRGWKVSYFYFIYLNKRVNIIFLKDALLFFKDALLLFLAIYLVLFYF